MNILEIVIPLIASLCCVLIHRRIIPSCVSPWRAIVAVWDQMWKSCLVSTILMMTMVTEIATVGDVDLIHTHTTPPIVAKSWSPLSVAEPSKLHAMCSACAVRVMHIAAMCVRVIVRMWMRSRDRAINLVSLLVSPAAVTVRVQETWQPA